MPFYRINGMALHIKLSGKGSKSPPAPCVSRVPSDSAPGGTQRCCAISAFLCDWPTSDGKTCDAPLCDDHAHRVGRNRDYCGPHHAAHLHANPQLGLFTALVSHDDAS